MRRQQSRSAWAGWASLVAVAVMLLPAGMPERDTRLQALLHRQQIEVRLAALGAEAQSRHLASRYRRPVDQVAGYVAAARRAGERHGLAPSLLLAIAETESSLNPSARSRYGAVGLMQVVPRHHPELVRQVGGSHRLLDGEVAIDVAAGILADYVRRSGSLERGLLRYSGGSPRYPDRVLTRMAALDQVALAAVQPFGTLAAAGPADRSAAVAGIGASGR